MTDFDLSDFLNMPVVRRGGRATVVVDTFEGKPVRLIGFAADAELGDMEIQELALAYYRALCDEIRQPNPVANQDATE
jgi:hypothetical protein